MVYALLGLFYKLLPCYDLKIWMCVIFGDFKWELSVSVFMGCNSYIAD